MQSAEQKNGQLVLPGERLGVIEEFSPNAGTYVKDGVIYSKIVGRALLDFASRHVSVYPLTLKARVPKIGSIILGNVSTVQNENANVRIFQVDDKRVLGVFAGVLHIADVQPRYVESMFEVCKPGDVIRAAVISDKNRVFHLSTKDKNLGVVYGFCSNCGNLLEPKRQGMLCSKCGKIESRKTAFDYGKGLS